MQLDINQILNKACQNIVCPLCGQKHQIDEVMLRGFFDEVYIFQTKCCKNHPLLVSIFITALNNETKINTDLKTFSKTDSNIETKKRIIDNIHKQINEFDGDFIKLWKK